MNQWAEITLMTMTYSTDRASLGVESPFGSVVETSTEMLLVSDGLRL